MTLTVHAIQNVGTRKEIQVVCREFVSTGFGEFDLPPLAAGWTYRLIVEED